MGETCERLRVAFVAGQLVQSGAEKQLLYIVRALLEAGAEVRVYSLTRGDFYETALRARGVTPIWIGRASTPLLRLAALTAALRNFRPHIVQSANFFTNLYAAVAGKLWRTITIGALRSDVHSEIALHGRWGPWLLRLPPVLLANSYQAQRNAVALGRPEPQVHVLPNVIDLDDFDAQIHHATALVPLRHPTVVGVGRLAPEKRWDRFIDALALARQQVPALAGVLVGDGPERARLEAYARQAGLLPPHIRFLGHSGHVPAILEHATMLALCSDHEGFPNVLLEAMAARAPVITTAVGDAPIIVQQNVTGYVVSCDDTAGLAERMIEFAQAPERCMQFGAAGRRRVEQCYSFISLPRQLLSAYRAVATQCNNQHVLRLLPC